MPPCPSVPFQIAAPSQTGYQNAHSGRTGTAMNQTTGRAANSRQHQPPRREAGGCGVESVGTSRT